MRLLSLRDLPLRVNPNGRSAVEGRTLAAATVTSITFRLNELRVMMGHRIFVAISMLFAALAIVASNSAFAKPTDDFYWIGKSYGRGVGTPGKLVCGSGEDEDGGLCYKPCRDGYKGVGPVCWLEKDSYGRGAGVVPELEMKSGKLRQDCDGGRKLQDGLCYRPCRDGFKGRGPVCWRDDAPLSYGRGAGGAMKLTCGKGDVLDAGLCYPACRSGYHGVGPVCWGDAPGGYVLCGLGFAKQSKDNGICASVIANQVAAVGFLALDVYALKTRSATKAAQLGEKIGRETMEKFFKEMKIPPTSALDDFVKGFTALFKATQPVMKSIDDMGRALAKGQRAAKAMGEMGKIFASEETYKSFYMMYKAVSKGKVMSQADWARASDIDRLRMVTGMMGIVPGILAEPVLKAAGIPITAEAWDMFSDVANVISVFSWEEYKGD